MTKVLFLDLETTGLRPDHDIILEVGAILYDLKEDREITSYSAQPENIRGGSEEMLRFSSMTAFVYAMHTTSGLFADRLAHGGGLKTSWMVERDLLLLLHGEGLFRGECMLAGFSVGFDKSFLREHMPLLEDFLSHRVIDASVLKSLSKAYGKEWPKKEPAHRALADCREAIEVVKHFRSAIESVEPL